MEIAKIIGICLVGAIIFNLVKTVKSELSIFVVICTGVLVLGAILSAIGGILLEFQEILDVSGIDQDLFGGVIKVVGIGYITEYSASLCRDSGVESLANKMLLAGKIAIFALSLPLIKGLIEMLVGIVK